MQKQRSKCNHKKITATWKSRRNCIEGKRLDKMILAKERKGEQGKEALK